MALSPLLTAFVPYYSAQNTLRRLRRLEAQSYSRVYNRNSGGRSNARVATSSPPVPAAVATVLGSCGCRTVAGFSPCALGSIVTYDHKDRKACR
jgi:hypothetical protein